MLDQYITLILVALRLFVHPIVEVEVSSRSKYGTQIQMELQLQYLCLLLNYVCSKKKDNQNEKFFNSLKEKKNIWKML